MPFLRVPQPRELRRRDQFKPGLAARLQEGSLLQQFEFTDAALDLAVVRRAIAADQRRIPVARVAGQFHDPLAVAGLQV